MSDRKFFVKGRAAPAEVPVYELDETPEDMTEEIFKTLQDCEKLVVKNSQGRRSALVLLLRRWVVVPGRQLSRRAQQFVVSSADTLFDE